MVLQAQTRERVTSLANVRVQTSMTTGGKKDPKKQKERKNFLARSSLLGRLIAWCNTSTRERGRVTSLANVRVQTPMMVSFS